MMSVSSCDVYPTAPPAYSLDPLPGEKSLSATAPDYTFPCTQDLMEQRSSIVDDSDNANQSSTGISEQGVDESKLARNTQNPFSDSSYLESMFGSSVQMKAAQAKAIEVFMMLITCQWFNLFKENHSFAVPDIKISSLWEYSIQTLVGTDDVEKEAKFYQNSIKSEDNSAIMMIRNPKANVSHHNSRFRRLGKFLRINFRQKNTKINKKNTKHQGRFINKDYYYDGEKSHLFSYEFLQSCKGCCLYANQGKTFKPISAGKFSLNENISRRAEKYMSLHNETADPRSCLLAQEQTVSLIPVYEVTYKDKQVPFTFYLVGTNHKAYLPNYPHRNST